MTGFLKVFKKDQMLQGQVTPWPGDTTIRCVQWEVSDTREPALKVDRMIYPFLFSIFFLLATN